MSFPGVPVLSGGNPLAAQLVLLGADAFVPTNTTGSFWGIYYQGHPIIVADSVISFEFKNEFRMPTYPQENGAFQTYNKVAMPYTARVAMARGGNDADRLEFMNQLDAAAASLNLYTIVTPERTYINANIEHVDYRRTAERGKTLITADIWLIEIRNTAVAQQSSPAPNPSTPSGTAPVSVGFQQPATATTALITSGGRAQ